MVFSHTDLREKCFSLLFASYFMFHLKLHSIVVFLKACEMADLADVSLAQNSEDKAKDSAADTQNSIFRNSDVNKMTKAEIVEHLKIHKLNISGNKDTLSKRLKSYYKRKRMMSEVKSSPKNSNNFAARFYDYFCVLDFECTCVEGSRSDFPHEIIEFPVFLVDAKTGEIVDSFHQFCKPRLFPQLSSFCTHLTGITQDQVNEASSFPEVFSQFRDWLSKHKLGTEFRYAFVTDGPWDLGKFLQLQCLHDSLKLPPEFRYWVNIRRSYIAHYLRNKPRVRGLKMLHLLDTLGLSFEGRQHSGRDDAFNIARILAAMLADGVQIRVNERLNPTKRHRRPTRASYLTRPFAGLSLSVEKIEHANNNNVLEDEAEPEVNSEEGLNIENNSNSNSSYDEQQPDTDNDVGCEEGDNSSNGQEWHTVTKRNMKTRSVKSKKYWSCLPRRFIPVSKPEFLANAYLEYDDSTSSDDNCDNSWCK